MRRFLREIRHGAQESICDCAFQYRTLCLRYRSDMPEKEVIQSILRNCNPRLTSLLRGMVKSGVELVRIGIQIERDFEESKKYWSSINSESQKKEQQHVQGQSSRSSVASTNTIQSETLVTQPRKKDMMFTLPVLLRG